MKLIALVITLLTSACSTQYAHPTKGDQEFYRDHSNCQVKEAQVGNVNIWRRRAFMNRCMAGYGWSAD